MWFRVHNDIIDDEKIRLIAFEDRWHYVALLALKSQGVLDDASPLRTRKIAIKLGVQLAELDEIKRRLMEVGLIDADFQPVGWAKRQFLKDGQAQDKGGHLYFAGCRTGAIRIGFSRNPWARAKDPIAGTKAKPMLLASIRTTSGNDPDVLDLLSEYHISNDLYRRDACIVCLIKCIKNNTIKSLTDVANYVANYVATDVVNYVVNDVVNDVANNAATNVTTTTETDSEPESEPELDTEPEAQTDVQERPKTKPSAQPVARDVPPRPTAKIRQSRPRTGDPNSNPEPPSPSSTVWSAYASGFRCRYGVDPIRNAKVNSQISQLVKRLGADEAPGVAEFYTRHNRGLYTSARHCVDLLLRDAESLRMEWVTGQTVTDGHARQVDRTQTNYNAFAPLIAEARSREAAARASIFDDEVDQ